MKIFFTYIILLLNINLIAQQKIKQNSSVYFDHLDNIYTINNGTLDKQNPQGKHLEYQNNLLGNITLIDVSDPLRILVFYKDVNQIVFLNNELSPINQAIQLDELSLFDIDWVCNASINGFWVFNKIKNRLMFYDKQLNLKYKSMDLSAFVNEDNAIKGMKMFGDKIYLNIPKRGVLVFDMFASYIKTIPLKQVVDFQVLSPNILYSKAKDVFIFDMNKLNQFKILTKNALIKTIYYNNQKLHYFSGNILSKVKMKL